MRTRISRTLSANSSSGQEGNEREMGKEQELTQAIKNNDAELVKKVLAKFKTKSSKLS